MQHPSNILWIYGYMDIWIYGYIDIWIYGYMDIQIALRAHSATVPSTTLARWLPWCMAPFCYRCKLQFVPYLHFLFTLMFTFMLFGNNFWWIWEPFGLHFHLIGQPKAAWDQKLSRKASRSEKAEFPEPSPPHLSGCRCSPIWHILPMSGPHPHHIRPDSRPKKGCRKRDVGDR